MLVCLLILTITFFLLTLYSIVQTNAVLLGLEGSPLFALKILDTSSAASLFVTLLGALLVRHQFAVSVLPRINYKSARSTKENPTETFETWRVELRNTGLGSAIVNRTEYRVAFTAKKDNNHSYSFEDLLKQLATIKLVRDRDYWVEKITTGFSLSPKDECFVFEIKTEHLSKFSRLDMVLYFQGQLSDKYRREVYLIPRV